MSEKRRFNIRIYDKFLFGRQLEKRKVINPWLENERLTRRTHQRQFSAGQLFHLPRSLWSEQGLSEVSSFRSVERCELNLT